MVGHIAIKKIVRAVEAMKTIRLVTLASVILAAMGFYIYYFIDRSSIILLEAFVWLVEALSFMGLYIAFAVAASRAVNYRARYEILRLETLAALMMSIVSAAMVLLIFMENVMRLRIEEEVYTRVYLALYPIISAVFSILFERYISVVFSKLEIKIASLGVLADKLRLDFVFELAGGLAIVGSNTLNEALIEPATSIAIAVYVLYGLTLIAYESVTYLIGVGPRSRAKVLERRIKRIAGRASGLRILRVRVRLFGTFGEVEVWAAAPPETSLSKATRQAIFTAKTIVREVPEILRAIVIPVPEESRRRYIKSPKERLQEPVRGPPMSRRRYRSIVGSRKREGSKQTDKGLRG